MPVILIRLCWLPEGKRPGKGRGAVWRQFQAQARVEELLFLALSGFRAKKENPRAPRLGAGPR
ncbi:MULTISPECIES: hypothetical protein [unclassified Neomoorella]|uniref:hypothetical protein n=1 Tax=unclassified Neomoorella TaxID=2676739 RepID=UPI001143B42C|nr:MULTISPECIES: hypothetical protein [unclassified Moorella (in: firmicutes)]